MMTREEMLKAADTTFRKAGFHTSERCTVRPSCFDFAARRRGQLAFVKAPCNIGSISGIDASELRSISACFAAAPLFVCDKARDKPLEDDTVYTRYDVYVVTPKTVEDVVFRDTHPLIGAGPGGYYVSLDGDDIKKRRQKLGLSAGKLAELMGSSRRTVYGYERGTTKASVATAYNLEWILGVPVIKPINLLEPPLPDIGFFATARRAICKNRFLKAVLKKLARCNFRVALTRRAPFDFIAQFPDEGLSIIGGVADTRERDVDKRTKEIMSVSGIVKAQPIFITDRRHIPQNDIPLIHQEELLKLRLPEDILSRF